jgi:hypothetical protein
MQYDSDIAELIEVIDNSHDKEDSLSLLKALSAKFGSKDLENATREFAEKNGLCYECECKMEVNSWKESRPYGDTYYNEELYNKVCPECGEEY